MTAIVKLTYIVDQSHLLSLFDYQNKNCTFKLKLYPLQAENVKYQKSAYQWHMVTFKF